MTTANSEVKYTRRFEGLSKRVLWELQCYLGREGTRTLDDEKRYGHVYLLDGRIVRMDYKDGTFELTEDFSEEKISELEGVIKSQIDFDRRSA